MTQRALAHLVAVAVAVAISHQANAQPAAATDSTSTTSHHSPTGALWRSAVLPGLGQVYNRQLIKVPIIAAALGGLTWLAVHNDQEFNRYNRAYLYGAYINEDPHPFPEYQDDYAEFPGITTTALRSRRDSFRRNRDLTIIGIVVAYGLNVLDAYVSGQLVDFDVGEDLASSSPLRPAPMKVTMKLRF